MSQLDKFNLKKSEVDVLYAIKSLMEAEHNSEYLVVREIAIRAGRHPEVVRKAIMRLRNKLLVVVIKKSRKRRLYCLNITL